MQTKQCSKCKIEKPATTEFFVIDKRKRYGVGSRCRECVRETARERYKQPDFRPRKLTPEAQVRKNAKRREKRATDPKFREHERLQRLARDPEKRKVSDRKYREKNREKITIAQRERRKQNPEKFRETNRRWIEANPEKAKLLVKRSMQKNPERVRLVSQQHRARKRNLPNSLNQDEWNYALNWFGACAYCGNKPKELRELQADHIVPLADPQCLGTVRENIVPACKTCNSSKCNRPLADWLKWRFGSRHADRVLELVSDYMKTIQMIGMES
ncbi:MAG: HNH endonuclease [Anaerolineae bacterium]|nr:HNH endonuclease [Anaerolineae bacterium]